MHVIKVEIVSKNPLSIGLISPTQGIVDHWYNDSTGQGDCDEIDADGP
jgi:Mn-containing catalase